MTINGKVALVTGAAQGIGRGIALRLAKDGADIAIVDINTDKMAEVAAEIEELGHKATTFKADVSNRAEVYAAVEHAEKTLGGLDIMVNNAGIEPPRLSRRLFGLNPTRRSAWPQAWRSMRLRPRQAECCRSARAGGGD
ncbi:SDR family NAD(P)-dependent oxidoreductase [Aurantimonas sp. E1-2-R+4]|uniref:SDR family NAD(P)-dependent oxidoreductase n=1 Tax=Aurantimonas sp. E1-2-R+4 TaxID=3113714 RepID=UPI002F94F0FC